MNPLAVQALISRLSDAELARFASSPPQQGMQYVAIMELDKRKQARNLQAPQQPSTTVLEDRVMQAQQAHANQRSSAASSPIRAGLAAILRKRGQEYPRATGMREGGPVSGYAGDFLADLAGILPEMQALMPGPSSPEEAMEYAEQFAGPDLLAPYLKRLDAREATAGDDRQRDRWLALARAGLSMMGPGDFWGNLSRGGLAGLDALNATNEAYNETMDSVLGQRLGVDNARMQRNRGIGAMASEALNDHNRGAFQSGLGAAEYAANAREGALDRSAANYRAQLNADELGNRVRSLAAVLWQSRQGSTVEENGVSRPYTEQDALREALSAINSESAAGQGDIRDEVLNTWRQVQAMTPNERANIDPRVLDLLQSRAMEILGGGGAPSAPTALPEVNVGDTLAPPAASETATPPPQSTTAPSEGGGGFDLFEWLQSLGARPVRGAAPETTQAPSEGSYTPESVDRLRRNTMGEGVRQVGTNDRGEPIYQRERR